MAVNDITDTNTLAHLLKYDSVLGNLRAGLIVAAAIPLSMLFAFDLMLRAGVAGTLMSLGAIDFGLIVDSSVIMVENTVRRLGEDQTARPTKHVVEEAAIEVRKPTMFGELIILVVYLPILALEGIEGRLFRPMALTVMFALIGSLILSLTVMPALCAMFLPRRIGEKENRFVRFHAMQSMITFGGLWVLLFILSFVPILGWLVMTGLYVVGVILWIVLMVKAYQGELFKLPMIGDIAEKNI